MQSPTIKTKMSHLLHKQVRNIKILKSLGSGANATVYLGEVFDDKKKSPHLKLHFEDILHHNHHHESNDDVQLVAVKQLHSEDQRHVQHLTEEYCIASQLNHDNIVKVFDLFYDHYWCYVSEYAGCELFKWIEAGMSTSQCNRTVKQLLGAVAYLDEVGICHRDIKPENILCHNENVKLCDFGLAIRYKTPFEDDDVWIEGIEGSDPYMAPEIWSGKYKGPPIDIWSVGIVYTAMVLKKKVWCQATEKDKYYAQYLSQRKNWRDFSGLTDAGLSLTLKILEPIPAKRITAKEAIAIQL
eukprot:NODE_24_length_41419_cov_0.818780.p14 type:complete len:298 gc:universal NODE_24_length_41419_cov_0.818780:37963-37070(-)